MNLLVNFHFLRPWLLLLILPAALLIWYIAWGRKANRGVAAFIAPHLLTHLLVGENRQQRLKPYHLLATFWLLGIIALAGPAWQREPSPFTGDTTGLVIALKVSPNMLAQDIQPSRLIRATQKIHDLLKLRPGAKTALIAYSGSAHLTMPLTLDPTVIDMFAQALEPKIMPTEGDAAGEAVALASALLDKAGIPGAILLVTDTVAENQLTALAKSQDQAFPLHIFAIAAEKGVIAPPDSPPAPALNTAAMQKAANAAGASLTIVTPDDGDVKRLAGLVGKSLSLAREDQGERWRDDGYWFLPILLIFGLFFFRNGWVVSYE